MDAPVLPIQEHEVVKAIAKKSVLEQFAEQIAQSEVTKVIREERVSEPLGLFVERIVQTEVAKASQLQHFDKLVDVPAEQAPRPIVVKTIEAQQLQYSDKVVNFLVQHVEHVPRPIVEQTIKAPQLQFTGCFV